MLPTLTELLHEMQRKYPAKHWTIETEDGYPELLFGHDGWEIWNPTAGIPDWVEVDSVVEYGIEKEDAELIRDVNLANQGI